MAFIVAPKTEGETKECPECKVRLVARLTDYKGRFPDKLQWQSETERKAHYDKDGNCKGQEQIPNEIELKPSKQSTITLNDKYSIPNTELDYLIEEIEKLKALESLVTVRLIDGNQPPNPARVGMYMKFLWDTMEENK